MSFEIGNYRANDSMDPEGRNTAVEQFRAEDLTSGRPVSMTVLDARQADDTRSVIAELDDVQHPHLLPVEQVVQDADRVAVICRWPADGRLVDLLDRRHTLTIGETLTVLIPLASALTEVHRAGARHGDLGPATVWFDRAGRPMLGALGVARVVVSGRSGLPSQIRDVAPEVVRGQRPSSGAVTSAADVFSLGSVALRCLVGRPAWPADDPADVLIQSAAGLWPDLADDAAPPGMVTLVRAMLQSNPARRPTAAEVAKGLLAVGPPEPIRLGPVRAAQSSRRWRGWAEQADRQLPTESEPEPEPADSADSWPTDSGSGSSDPAKLPSDPSSGSQDADGDLEGTEGSRDPDDGPHHRTPGRLARAGIAVLAGLLVAVVAVQVGLWLTGNDDPGETITDGAGTSVAVPQDRATVDWLEVITDLDATRARAFAAADSALLTEVYVAQSMPALADAATIADLAARGWTVQGGVHVIASVAIDPVASIPGVGTAVADEAPVRVIVRDSLPARPIVDSAGQQVGLTTNRPEQQRILTLLPTTAGYRISAVDLG